MKLIIFVREKRKLINKPVIHANHVSSQPGLRRGVVTFWELVYVSISFTAPAIASLATLSAAVAFAYGSEPLSMVIAIIAIALAAYPVYEFSRYVASSGGYYRLIERGLGTRPGAWAGWVYLLYSMIGATPFIYLETALVVQYGLSLVGISLPSWSWIPLGLLDAALALVLPYLGVKPSVRYLLWTGLAEMTALMVAGIVVLMHVPHPWDPLVFTPYYSPTGWVGVGTAIIFTFTAISGWGTMVFFGIEAKAPRENIRRGLITVIGLYAVFFTFTIYYLIVGWGPSNASTYFQNFIPGLIEILKYGGPLLFWIIFALTINSGFSDTIAIISAAARDMYTMAKDGAFPSVAYKVHPKYRSPHIALIINTLIGILLFLALGLTMGPLNAFLVTGLWTGIGPPIEHTLLNIAFPLYTRRRRKFNVLHAVIPAIASAIYLYAIYATFATTAISTPVLVGVAFLVVWLIGTFIYSWRRPVIPRLEEGEEL